ncbi:hypothetical protein GCM10009679_26910 [Saccharothrix algeriensis]|uniref:Uncharacterized protein n=1 Tax=Catellatospora bangladeshensis TaxID=310355 RepID=A0A8J3JLL4_9ACTN|nr:hypothetical protein Cba03nite_15280 [Catellatospora bangladeshensis]
MLFTYAADERCTGSFDTSARHTLSAGNTPHAAAGEAEAAALGLGLATADGPGVAEPGTNTGVAGAASGVALPQAASPNTAVSAASRRGTAARERESTRRI